jgi:hypothetical protein
MPCNESAKAKVYTGRIPISVLSFSFNVLLQTGENMTFITVAVISALCLVFSATRKYGVVGAGMLLYFQPYYTIGVLVPAAIAYFYIRKHQRRNIA